MMGYLRNRHTGTLLAAILAVAFAITGCGDNTSGPGEETPGAPTLPEAARLQFDYSFFQPDSAARAADDDAAADPTNYFNARIRIAIIRVVTELVLTPPVTAFALAIHTVPSPQPDGSYLWIYTWVQGEAEAQIRLRGTPAGDHVIWELRVSNNASVPPVENELWFEGESSPDGTSGFFRFHDFNRTGDPIVARIDWNDDDGGYYLAFTDQNENPGDQLAYSVSGSQAAIDFVDASTSESWFIHWNTASGTGSLRAPDYHGGAEACWDQHQADVECAPAS